MKLSSHKTRDMLDRYHQRRREHLLKTAEMLNEADAARVQSKADAPTSARAVTD